MIRKTLSDEHHDDSHVELLTCQYVLLAMYPYYNNLFGANLERAGFDVRKRTTIDSAIKQLREVRPGLVVLLIGYNHPRGLELLQVMKSTPEFATIPVFGVVEEKRGDLIPKAYAAGIDECYLIPFSPLDLVSGARKILPSSA